MAVKAIKQKKHTLMSVCVPCIHKTRFSPVILKMPEVHEKMKHANKTRNMSARQVRFSSVIYAYHATYFLIFIDRFVY